MGQLSHHRIYNRDQEFLSKREGEDDNDDNEVEEEEFLTLRVSPTAQPEMIARRFVLLMERYEHVVERPTRNDP